MKEDASSPTVSSEPVMLTCVADANKKEDVTVVNIRNAFDQMVFKDEKDRAFICICDPVVDVLASIAPDVYGLYVTVGMMTLLLYYKRFDKSLRPRD